MTRHESEMSGVGSVEFDRATRTLRITFATGAVYDFADVPERIYEDLLHSPTPDVVFDQRVRDEFVSRRVGEVDLAEIAEERREDAILGPPLAGEILSLTDEQPIRRAQEESAEPRRSHHTWVIDVIDEDSAAVEVDGRQITPMPRWVLPTDVREGDVLRVSHVRSRRRSTLTIETDEDAKREALERSAEQLRDMPVSGRGDVDL